MSLTQVQKLRYLATALLLAVSILVPLKTLFACNMMDTVSEQCCCEKMCADVCLSREPESDTCCNLIYLPEPAYQNSAAAAQEVHFHQRNPIELPAAIFAADSGPDPPALSLTHRSHYAALPLWFPGTHTYLVTLRLRN